LTQWSECLDFAVDVARAAGQAIREGYGGQIGVYSKGLRNLLTDVDLAAEQIILDAIHATYPEHDVLSEESPPEQRRSAYQWIVDPLDGTGNFTHGYPCFSTSIALAVKGESLVGAVYDPMRDHLFAASLGHGATLNGERLEVSSVERMLDTIVGMDWTRDPEKRSQIARIIARQGQECGTLRVCGSAALGICYVGAGWWDAYWHLGLQAWDAAAGALVVREAGGQVTDLAGDRWQPGNGPCLVSNGRLHARFQQQIAQAIESDVGG
jgi:myo-inositol-1(or 4)-monophosphatase